MEEQNENPIKGVIVPLDKISEDALSGLIEEFILREGTDYGQHEYTLSEKNNQVRKQLLNGKAFVVFDPAEQTASIMRAENIPSELEDTLED